MARPKAGAVIRLRGVRHNNLKNFDLDLPLRRLIVITGLSGSGKSSLAFDTLYAEGQRRYIETFSPYARQFFDRMDKPQVDRIEGIPPAIAIEQRNAVRSTRSTVGTMTELCEHMKLLWPHVARLHCRQCGQPVRKEPPQAVWTTLNAEGQAQPAEVLVTFDLPLSEKLSVEESLMLITKQGYQRLWLNGEVVRLEEALQHSALRTPGSALTVVQDRLRLAPANRARFIEACEQAYHFGKGKLAVYVRQANVPHSAFRTPRWFSAGLHCARCDLDYREPSPALFSFNHPVGACPQCKGFGRIISIDYNLAIPDRSKSLRQGAVKPWQSGMSADCQKDLMKFCRATDLPVDVPFAELSPEQQRWVVEGDPDYGQDEEHEWPRAWYGVKGYFRWLESKAYKMHVRVLLSRYRAYTPCPACRGARLNPEALLFTISDLRFTPEPLRGPTPRKSDIGDHRLTLADFYALPVRDSLALIEVIARLRLSGRAATRANDPLKLVLEEVRSRLRYLDDIGLGYLALDRPTRTLSGGETERVNLTTCLGTRLVNTLFVLDEPSVGLHPRDTGRLIAILKMLREAGNTVVVVEHERSVMEAADEIVDLGPGHGATGGELVFQGTYKQILKSGTSLTGKYLSHRTGIQIPARRPVQRAAGVSPADQAHSLAPRGKAGANSPIPVLPDSQTPGRNAGRTMEWLRVTHATRNNLKGLDVDIPLNRFVCISGVSGSGKSTLVRDVLLPGLHPRLGAQADTLKASDRLDSDSDTGGDSEAPTHTGAESGAVAGHEALSQVVLVDQSILGKTPRSNPAVYIGAFDDIREVFAQSGEARTRGLNASAFSFNSAQGQCERCRGAGYEKIEMQFLSDVFIRCSECNGRRYREHILQVRVQSAAGSRRPKSAAAAETGKPKAATGWSIADMLEATVDEAVEFLRSFAGSKPAQRAAASLSLLQEVGLGYLQLGQPINTLSGGESQRLKLVRHLAESRTRVPPALHASTGLQPRVTRRSCVAREEAKNEDRRDACPTLFLLDEPTTGLHFDDVRVLLGVFQKLVDAGHSLVVIEHNLDVLKCADWIIDLGPDAGDDGGELVVAGTPEDVACCTESHTGRFLRDLLRIR